jgi:hypothetical protein
VEEHSARMGGWCKNDVPTGYDGHSAQKGTAHKQSTMCEWVRCMIDGTHGRQHGTWTMYEMGMCTLQCSDSTVHEQCVNGIRGVSREQDTDGAVHE